MISVIIPVYNAKERLKICIDSIINQSYSNFEILIVDDGSTDGSDILCDELAKADKRIKVFHKENGGVSTARNMGIDNAEGKYLVFVDADDTLSSNGLELMRDKICKNQVDMAIAGKYINYYDKYEEYLPINKSVVIS